MKKGRNPVKVCLIFFSTSRRHNLDKVMQFWIFQRELSSNNLKPET